MNGATLTCLPGILLPCLFLATTAARAGQPDPSTVATGEAPGMKALAWWGGDIQGGFGRLPRRMRPGSAQPSSPLRLTGDTERQAATNSLLGNSGQAHTKSKASSVGFAFLLLLSPLIGARWRRQATYRIDRKAARFSKMCLT